MFNFSALLELHSVHFGEVQIRGLETNLYLAMNSKGRLYAEVKKKITSINEIILIGFN